MIDILKAISGLRAAMEANYLAYFSGFAQLPYMELRSEAGITCLVSSKRPDWNTVLRTQLPSEDVAARVEAIMAPFKSSNTQLVWQVLPWTRPADLECYLEACGLRSITGRPHMAADLLTLPSELPSMRDLTIERVSDQASFARWFRASTAGFEMSEVGAQIYFDAYTLLGFGQEGPFLHYVGYLRGEPVTASTLLLAGGVAGVYDVSTAPAVRRRGLGAAITLAPLVDARARGYRYACLQATEAGYNVYRGLGFEEQYRERNYSWDG